jgi:hypothetical protein
MGPDVVRGEGRWPVMVVGAVRIKRRTTRRRVNDRRKEPGTKDTADVYSSINRLNTVERI